MTEQPNFYVVTLRGDRGPLSRQDLVEQLRGGEIAAGDRVRNAFGRPLGTVGEVLGSERAQRSGTRSETPRRQQARPAAPAARGLPPLAIIVAVAALAVIGLAVLLWPSRPPPPPTPVADPPRPAERAQVAPPAPTPVVVPAPRQAAAPTEPGRKLAPAAVVADLKPGLRLDIFRLNFLPEDFPVMAAAAKPDWTGVVGRVSHDLCEKERLVENIYARWTGYLDLLKPGDYTFFLTSDDGSRLSIDGKVVVDNGGSHGAQERSGSVALAAGPHAVCVEFFQGNGGMVLSLEFQLAGFPRTELPESTLAH